MPILISTCPRGVLNNIRHHRQHVMIVMHEPRGPLGTLDHDKDRVGELNLWFGDYHQKHFDFAPELIHDAMTEYQGNQVREFLGDLWGKFETLIVSCAAGVSRSPSMALAIAEKVGVKPGAIEPCSRDWSKQPLNPWVFLVTKKALASWNPEL